MKVLILTKSYKRRQNNQGQYAYCVAGIDCNTGEWVRLVNDDQGGALFESQMQVPCSNGKTCSADKLDIVEVPIDHDAPYGLQPENKVIVAGQTWRYYQTLNTQQLVNYLTTLDIIDKKKLIFGSTDEYEPIGFMKRNSPNCSLGVFTATDIQTSKFPHGAYLDCQGYNYPKMTITDPYYRKRYTYIQKALIVVSISAEGYNGGSNIFKFVSAIYPI